ncbi:MAG: phosphatase PAP2 family protein [Allosphingosinicella sp.]|uniref:phosphatase PAP2 family protein n=1 Tax=Allosphingosinicella sp. TaxID=2823234 RepID=UPI003933A539
MAKKKRKNGHHPLVRLDEAVAKAAAPHEETLPVRLLAGLAETGDQPPMLGLCGGLVVAGLAAGDPRLFRAGLRMTAAHLLATGVKNFVKARIDRTRPRTAVRNGGSTGMKPGRTDTKEETSFPSGHAAGAAAVARAFAREYPEHGRPAAAAGGVIALAQIPRCAHYPSDVGAGLAIGLAAEAAVSALLPRWRRND